jgi:plastocyanin
MHALAAQLPVILAAEKSRTAFYIVGGVLVAWALVLSLALGLRQVDFPRTKGLERLVIGISAALVLATGGTAVVTAGTPAKTAAAAPATAPAAPGAPKPPAAPSAPAPPTAALALSLEANPGGELRYNTKELTAKAGTITITFTNNSPLEHNVTVAKPGLRGTAAGALLGATPTFKGGSRRLTLTLQAGTYVYYCSVPGHREAGMEGTLKVT